MLREMRLLTELWSAFSFGARSHQEAERLTFRLPRPPHWRLPIARFFYERLAQYASAAARAAQVMRCHRRHGVGFETVQRTFGRHAVTSSSCIGRGGWPVVLAMPAQLRAWVPISSQRSIHRCPGAAHRGGPDLSRSAINGLGRIPVEGTALRVFRHAGSCRLSDRWTEPSP